MLAGQCGRLLDRIFLIFLESSAGNSPSPGNRIRRCRPAENLPVYSLSLPWIRRTHWRWSANVIGNTRRWIVNISGRPPCPQSMSRCIQNSLLLWLIFGNRGSLVMRSRCQAHYIANGVFFGLNREAICSCIFFAADERWRVVGKTETCIVASTQSMVCFGGITQVHFPPLGCGVSDILLTSHWVQENKL